MTVLAAVRVPGKGCVLAADSRVTAGTSIVTDTCVKVLRCGAVVAGVSGHDGSLLTALKGTRNWDEVLRGAFKYAADHPALDWSLLVYDSGADVLRYVDSDETVLDSGLVATGGCGAPYARGWLDAQAPARTLEVARAQAMGAVRAAIKRDSACGGRVRTIVLRT